MELAKLVGQLLKMKNDEDDVPVEKSFSDLRLDRMRASLADQTNIDPAIKGKGAL